VKKYNLFPLIALAGILLSVGVSPSPAQAGSATVYVAGSGNEFGTLDLTTGNFTYIGTMNLPVDDNLYGMGFAANGKLYGLDSSLPTSNLYQIDISNANATRVNAIGQSAIDATADAAGKMYALTQDPTNSTFYTLNPPSTTTTLVGPTGVSSTGLMAVNASGTQIFTGAFDSVTGTTDLYRINPQTGVATLVGDTGFFVINGLFVGGKLYGFDDNTNAIVSIDTTTGAGTQVATYNYSGMPGLGTPNNPTAGDAIFASAVLPGSVPEPSSAVMGLIALAAVGSLSLLRHRFAPPTD
jgi:hypothetical protein